MQVNARYLHRVLKEYSEYYNNGRPHKGIRQDFPISRVLRSTREPIRKRDILGGIIHDYYRQPQASISSYG